MAMAQRTLSFLLFAAAAVAASCRCTPTRTTLSSGYEIVPSPVDDATPVTTGVMLVADNQIHYLYGEPTYFRSGVTDAKLSKVAVRPPQLDAFGQDLLARAIEQARAVDAIIHLGDALDFACEVEWQSFLRIMQGATVPWVMIPGNHDAYFFGNFENEDRAWESSCSGGGGPVHKDRLVQLYMAALAAQPQNQALARRLATRPDEGQWTCAGTECAKSFLQEVAWKVDVEAPWRSFVLQRVDLGYCHPRQVEGACSRPVEHLPAVLIDTVQYRSPVRAELKALTHAAGKRGSMMADQRDVIAQWAAAVATPQQPLTVMGHHPYHELDAGARRVVDAVIERGSPLYVSAHTHTGGYYVHGPRDKGWLELNIGSIVDWKPHYRLLQFFRRDRGRLGMRAWYRPVDEAGRNPCRPESGWEPMPEDPDFYLSYMRLGTLAKFNAAAMQKATFDILLASYDRLFRCLPLAGATSGPLPCSAPSPWQAAIGTQLASGTLRSKRDLLRRLAVEADNPDRFADRMQWTNYRQCQALWASKYERHESRMPVVEDEHFLFPQGASNQ